MQPICRLRSTEFRCSRFFLICCGTALRPCRIGQGESFWWRLILCREGWCRSALLIPVLDCPTRFVRDCSSHSSQPSRMAWEWDCPSAGLLLKRIEADYGPTIIRAEAQSSALPFGTLGMIVYGWSTSRPAQNLDLYQCKVSARHGSR